jgi:predicted RNase H-like HicB family nuclease
LNYLQYYLGLPYTIEIVSDEDGYFARVLELPGCMIYADTIGHLSPMIEEAMRDWIKVALKYGEDIPEPLQRSYLGAEE